MDTNINCSINKLSLKNFRNFSEIEFIPSKNVNIIMGENAQGKTNLIEAIWLFTGAKSFRSSSDKELVRFDADYYSLHLDFFSEDRTQKASITYGQNKKKIKINEIEKKNAASLTEIFSCVVFSPTHLNLIRGLPGLRRLFVDSLICQIKPSYIALLKDYKRITSQRNALLCNYNKNFSDLLQIINAQLAAAASRIIRFRYKTIGKINTDILPILEGISNGKESLTVHYNSTVKCSEDESEITRNMLELLNNNFSSDLKFKSTSIGPHRDDIEFFIDNQNAKKFASQGQQRSIVLALKLCEAGIIEFALKRKPVILLDDVMSELDVNRQHYLVKNLVGRQVFITSCDTIKKFDSASEFVLADKKIIKI